MASWTRKQDSGPYETAEFVVSAVIPIVLIIVGTLGNLLCIIFLLNKKNRQTSTNIYLVFLCIMDTLSLYQWNLSYIVFQFTGGKRKISDQSLFLCKWSQFLSFYTLHTSAMFLTLVALDRACLLWSGWYKRKIARTRVALAFCVMVLLALFALNGFLFGLGVEYTVFNNSTGTHTTVIGCYNSLNVKLSQFFADQYSWIHLVVMYFVPFIVMFLCTILTVKKLVVKQTSDNQQLAQSAKRNRNISIMLLLMCLSYVILTLPNRLCFSVFTAQIIGHGYTDTVFLSSNTLMYSRNAINAFFLYASVHGFRRDLRKLILKCCGKLRGRIVPQQANGRKRIDILPKLHKPDRSVMIQMPIQTCW